MPIPYVSRIVRWGDTAPFTQFADVLIRHIGSLRTENPARSLTKALAVCSWLLLPPEVVVYMKERELPAEVRRDANLEAFIRDSVTLAAPHTAYAASLLMTTVTHYVLWCVKVKGWPLQPEVIWSVLAIDLYSQTANQHVTEGTRANYRARLVRIGEVLLPEEHPERLTPMNKRGKPAPYTPEEMARFRAWAGLQLTDLNRDRAMLMLVLCAGAGIRPQEIPFIHHEHVTVDELGVLIHLPIGKPRSVPLLAEWEEWMTVLLERRPQDGPLWGPITRRNTHNLTSVFTERANGHPPRADRLRHTWTAHHLTVGTPLKEYQRASGVEKLGDLHLHLEHVKALPDEQYRRTLRGEADA